MSNDVIRYDLLTQEALRGVMREALLVAARRGSTPGEHHFYITFRTNATGVEMSHFLREQYPQEMTIVIQHQFWDLEVFENKFAVVLKFGGTPQTLQIPFRAVTKFVDPSVQLGLEFIAVQADEFGVDGVEGLLDAEEAAEVAEQPAAAGVADGAAVVELDAFRKKK